MIPRKIPTPGVGLWAASGLLMLGLWIGSASTATAQTLPEGNNGIAARYPNDDGIISDAAVVFADDFESYGNASSLATNWSDVFQLNYLRIVPDQSKVFSGAKAVEMTLPQQSAEDGTVLAKRFSPDYDVLFLRFYAKFDAAYNVAQGSSHNGGTIEADYCCPGVPADGYNKFFVSYEAGREGADQGPGRLKAYVYHPDQRDVYGDHFFPTGRVAPFDAIPGDFGPTFVPRPDVVPELDRWYAYEMMVKANTPGQRDGRIAFWLDGELIADFPNLRLRETNDLKIDKFTIGLHIKSNTLGVSTKWYDNVVAATSYIGPMSSGTVPEAPTNLQAEP